jgi:iron complex outermembrane receptor protein
MRRVFPCRRLGGSFLAGLGVVALVGGPLRAETSAGDGELSEVIVTATKRETRAQDTPMSITVIDASTLAMTRADDFSGFAPLVPGLTAIDNGPGNMRYALRGLQSPGEPEVALYYDEVPISGLPGQSLDTGASQPDLKLWDIDRIEVLRGPQGTLYGNGTEGGAIRIISKRPDLANVDGAIRADGSVTSTGAGSHGINGMVNYPLVQDTFAVRIAVYDREVGGWINDPQHSNIALPQLDANNLNSERTRGGRISLRLEPLSNWSITGIAYYQRMDRAASPATYPQFWLPGNRYVSQVFVQTPWLDESHMYNLISDLSFPQAELFVTGSYQLRKVDANQDTTRYLLSLFGCTVFTWAKSCFGPPIVPADSYAHETVSAWSDEVRLVSRGTNRFQWTVGTALQNARTYRDGQVASVSDDGYINFDPATGAAVNELFARQNHDAFDQYSFFGNASYMLIPNVTIDAGLRWFHSDRSDEQVIAHQFFPGQPTGPEPFQRFEQGVLFKSFEVSYRPLSGYLFYGQAAQGFRAGGPNYPGGFTATAPPYRADSVWDYEFGSKLSFNSDRVRWNTAIFDIRWNDLQLLLPAALFEYITNAGSARSDGFESMVDAKLDEHFSLASGVTYNYARLVGPQPHSRDPSTQLVSGDKLAGVPEWTATASLIYKHSLGARSSFLARYDASYESGRSSIVPPQNSAYFVTKSYVLGNLHLTLECKGGWSAYMDIDNIFNRFAELSAAPQDSNLVQTITAARPRTVTLGIETRLGDNPGR